MTNLTALVLTYNESPNISRTLTGLAWVNRVVIIDSYSTDETLHLAAKFPNVSIHSRAFDSHAAQWSYGVDLVETEWVLALDADYVTDEAFQEELQRLQPRDECAYYANFVYCIFGHPLRASVYPARAVLFRKASAKYFQDGHTQRLSIDGKTGELRTKILHDDRKPLSGWLAAQDRYALLEAKHLRSLPSGHLSLQDRLRVKVYFAPLVMALYLLIIRGLILGGWPAWYYVFQRILAELLLSLRLIEERRSSPADST